MTYGPLTPQPSPIRTFGRAVGRAKTSATQTHNAEDSAEVAADYSFGLWTWLEKFSRNGWSWKMCRVSSRQTAEPLLSQLSTKWKKAGIWGAGQRATLSISVCPKTANVSSLSQALDPTVHISSLLTAANCTGIIRREEKNGRAIPALFKASLEANIRLWCSAVEASGTPKDRAFAPRFAPKPEAIKEAIRTDQYFVARNLTYNEWERLMGFPAGWTVEEGGSSVMPSLFP